MEKEALMSVRLSRERIESFVGDVLPLTLLGEGVSEYSQVEWRVLGESATIRKFDTDTPYSMKNGVLVTLVSVGAAEIIATYLGVEYRAEVYARPMRHEESSCKFNYYVGDMHDHTSMNHNKFEFATQQYGRIEDYLDYIAKDGRLDFGVISDHAGVTNDRLFYRGFTLTRDEGRAGEVIVFAGAESEVYHAERDRLGVLHRLSGEIVTINSAGYADTKTWDDFYQELSYSPRAVAIFAHPHVVGFSTNGIWNFDFMRNNTPRLLEIARGIEMGNGADRKENLLHEYAYSAALDAGFRVSTTCGSDSHGSAWGYGIMPGKTVILAKEKSREAFLDALISNRFYATESGNVKLSYSVNGSYAPADLALTDTYDFKVDISYFREDDSTRPVLLEVISDYGNPLTRVELSGSDSVAFTLKSDTARYFYLRLVDREGRKTWSMPTFTGRSYDVYSAPELTAVDMSAVRATVDGVEVPKLINGDPFNSWCADTKSATVTLELPHVTQISALGYYPHIILRGKDKGPEWTTSMESAGLVSAYSISASLDGEVYTTLREGRMQTLGSENIFSFESTPARFIRFEAKSTVGRDSLIPKYKDSTVKIANLTLFTPKG